MSSTRPSARKALRLKQAVIGDNVSGDFFHAASRDAVSNFSQNFFGRTFAFNSLLVWKFPVGEICITAADQDQIAVQQPIGSSVPDEATVVRTR